jgi:hypothetical protein
MPLCPQITITPVTVTSTGMTQTSVIAANAPVTTEQLAVVNTEVDAAVADAAAALTTANLAYTEAIGSLQPSANTIVNASNQITAINAGGITVYSGSSPDSGARVRLNNLGLAGFDASGNATFSISASTGAAVFSGSVTGAAITGSSLNIAGKFIVDGTTGLMTATDGTFAGTINSSTINGSTITGGTVQTSSGSSAVILNGASNAVQFRVSGGVVANMVPLGSGGLLMHYGATPDPSGGTWPQAFVGSSNAQISASPSIVVSVGTGFGASINGGSVGVSISGTTNVTGTMTVSGVFTATDAGTNTNTNTPNAWLSTGGVLRRSTASSERYKENITDIRDVAELNPKKLLEIPVRAFSYKPSYIKEQDDRAGVLMPGLIAEEVDAVYPLAADYEKGNVENINDRAILVNLLALVQDLYKEIALLKGE